MTAVFLNTYAICMPAAKKTKQKHWWMWVSVWVLGTEGGLLKGNKSPNYLAVLVPPLWFIFTCSFFIVLFQILLLSLL